MTVFRYMTRLFGRKRQVGCLFLCRKTGKLLLVERRIDDDGQSSWGMIGGPVYVDESMIEAAIRYAEQHAGYVKQPEDYLIKIDVYANPEVRHITFLYVIDEDFFRVYGDDYQAVVWVDLVPWPQKEWPRPLDRYIVSMLYNDRAVCKVLAEIRKAATETFENSL
jgi:ADP-ribose pyrophosphatase YjhB (NUDIX family)